MWFEKYNPLEANRAIALESKYWLAFWASYSCWYKSQDLDHKEDCESQVTQVQETMSVADKILLEYSEEALSNQISGQPADMARYLEVMTDFVGTVHMIWRPLTINNIQAYYDKKPAMINEVMDTRVWELIKRYVLNDKSIKDGGDPELVMLKSLMRIREVFEKVRPVKRGKIVPENVQRVRRPKDCMRIFAQIRYIDTMINMSRQDLYSRESNFAAMLLLQKGEDAEAVAKELKDKWESSYQVIKVFTKNLYGLLFELEELIVFGSSSTWVTAMNCEDLCDRLIVLHQSLARRNMELYRKILESTPDMNTEAAQAH